MNVLFAKLDKVFLAEQVDEMYDAFLKFFAHTKLKNDTMLQYIIEIIKIDYVLNLKNMRFINSEK